MISVLVTGKDSQLAQCIKEIEANFPEVSIQYCSSKTLDITDLQSIKNTFRENHFEYCINCAAYTHVDKAESDPEKAYAVNAEGVANLASVCKQYHTTLMHISTDYVFDGKKQKPYTEADKTNPINVYGKSKRAGELEIIKTLHKYFIIRTSWLYSEYGNNFVKTMLSVSKEGDQINVVNDQAGSPTYALDLADVVLKIIRRDTKLYGLYHFSNSGVCTWFDFATEIFKHLKVSINIKKISTSNYPTLAKRPAYGVLDSTKMANTFQLNIPHWRERLNQFLLTYRVF
ncbi:MAG: dTDP-4-dehydrorhamnose reductase [Winogradskyella sp.]|uniref:dTDP-4-dehydrorhamnose reductase n=1 Tax=Winogradskyella sp. TaxID=1883156 RepID=UPI0017D719F2|nr:dTDP-4-dehydrorhamnose reductase [Winogradskyella sp.]MBT8245445.1 dTDP-4-dehydrorhamnose reductase [Winogradskyella sp.]NNK22788.1 dTDP-4-dehydrorhamnose reductase [Winogradskyella sp.]